MGIGLSISKLKALGVGVVVALSLSGTARAYDTLGVSTEVFVGKFGITRYSGRAQQGIAACQDEETFYTSAGATFIQALAVDTTLFKYDSAWAQERSEEVDYASDLVHLGDIDLYNGRVYAPLTNQRPGQDLSLIEIAWFDQDTLAYEDHISVSWLAAVYEDLDDVSGLAFKDDWLYLLGYQAGSGWPRIFASEMNGNVPRSDSFMTYDMSTWHANGLVFKGDYAFVSWGQSDNTTTAYIDIYEYPLTQPASPIKTYQYPAKDWHAEGITFYGDELWVAQNEYVLQLENPIPKAPTGVTASDGSYAGMVEVRWNTVPNADGYDVYRSTSNDPESAAIIGSTIGGMNSVFDDTDVDDRSYYYWIKATKALDGGTNLVSEFSSYNPGYPRTIPGGETAQVYRFWSAVTSRHFYTVSESEKAKLIDDYSHIWTYEGTAYYAFGSESAPDVSPVYRFWSDSKGCHFYTISAAEKAKLIDDYSHVWTFEGEAFYAYAEGTQPAGTKAVHRFWSDSKGCHFYTTSESEKTKLIDIYSHVWTYEGIAWYAW